MADRLYSILGPDGTLTQWPRFFSATLDLLKKGVAGGRPAGPVGKGPASAAEMEESKVITVTRLASHSKWVKDAEHQPRQNLT